MHSKWPWGLTVLHGAAKTAVDSHGEHFQPEPGVLAVRAVDLAFVRDRFYATYADAEEDKKKRQAKMQKAFVRAIALAQERGLIKVRNTANGRTMVWLPSLGEPL